MRTKILLALLAIFSACSSLPAHAQDTDALADRYLRIYRAFQKGSNLETTSEFAQALDSYRSALDEISQLQKSAPDWNPQVVEYRQKKIVEAIHRIERKVHVNGDGASVIAPAASAI